ncbi:phosphotransferase family protein [Kribbella sp. CA-293567]|uniref:phosphotransferase family protein n=1 Tax=Kribbella sp. CA-293567 TaxID=3002436 RepID=UPI0022DD235B|nr:phosphotransferase [Kribbella sp. CA-293567]WBQ02373.1 phosphotransferase [Kribbella sp. CA-293567]
MDEFGAIAASAVPLAGGYGGETFAVSAGGEDAVLKLYGRRPERAAVDLSLMRLVRGLLPVPRVLDAMPEPAGDGAPPYVLYERLPGVNLETYLETAGDDERRRVGEQLGELLVLLSGMPFLSFGDFTGRELAIRPFGVGELADFFQEHAREIGLTREQGERIEAVIDETEELAETGADRICLVHSDFNPKNLLVDPETARITGLIDWEFAHAGSPYADLGNLLRFCADPVLGKAVLDVVRDGFDLGDRLVERARAADLWALIDLAARPAANPVTAAANALVKRIGDTGDLAGGRPDPDAVR